MWNALAGYGGLVSVGQQAYIGLGAYAIVFLRPARMNPYLAMAVATLFGARRDPVGVILLWLRGGAFAIATWVVAEVSRSSCRSTRALGGGTGIGADRVQLLQPDPRQKYTYWLALAVTAFLLVVVFVLLRSRARRVAAGDPRRRGRGGVGRRPRAAAQGHPVRARRRRLRRGRAP